MTISIKTRLFSSWIRLHPPDPARPFWHEADDGTRHHLRSLTAGLDPAQALLLEELHATAVRNLVAVALAARRGGDEPRARALACHAGRLCQETVGLHPAPAGPHH